MLSQNWFMDAKFDMFFENYEEQMFLDTTTLCIYVVKENEDGNIQINEYNPNLKGYEKYYEIYKNYIDNMETL